MQEQQDKDKEQQEDDPKVTSTDLQPEQALRLRIAVAHHLRYLNRLCDRMNRLGFPPNGPLYVAAERARVSAQDLHVAAHYVSCKQGVGRAAGK